MSNWVDFQHEHPDMEDFFLSTFTSLNDFNTKFKDYQDKYFQLLNIRGSHLIKNNEELQAVFYYNDATIVCKHGVKPRNNKVDGSRPNQHTYYTECPFSARLVFNSKIKVLQFSSYKLTHNHLVSKELYQSYTQVKTRELKQNDQAIKLQSTLQNAKASIYHQVESLNKEYDLNLEAKDLHNYIASQNPNKNASEADILWEELKNANIKDSNSIKLKISVNNDLECIFIQTKFMRNW